MIKFSFAMITLQATMIIALNYADFRFLIVMITYWLCKKSNLFN